MTAGNDVFKAIMADTSPFIVKGWLVLVYKNPDKSELSYGYFLKHQLKYPDINVCVFLVVNHVSDLKTKEKL